MTKGAGTALYRLRERGVLRVAASYAVIAWLLLQIADVTFEPLGVPRWVMVSLIVAAVIGFPVSLALAWFYEAGDRGIERDTAAAGAVRQKGRGLLGVILDRMRHEVGELGRPEYWYFIFHPAALAMNAEHDPALAMLERAVARKSNVFFTWQLFEIEPAFAELREHPRFQAVRAKAGDQNAGQRRELARLRSERLVPDRSGSALDDGQG